MIVGRQQMGLDIDLGKILGTSAQSSMDQLKTSIIGGLFATPDVQQAIKTSGQQAAVSGFAESFLKNPGRYIGGAVLILGFVYFMEKSK